MNYKFGENYDEFVCIDAEKEFIKNFLSGVDNYKIAKEQLIKIYELESDNYKNKIEDSNIFVEECLLLSNLVNRNKYLIELCEFERKNKSNVYDSAIRNLKENIKELNLNILQYCIIILEKKDNNFIFGKARDINLYINEKSKLTNKNVKGLVKRKV